MIKLILVSFVVFGCGTYERFSRVKNCTVVEQGGKVTVTCPDGTSATINPPEDGKDGKDGKQGQPGQDGARGPEGEQGPVGPAGQDGRDGQDGNDGVDGANGSDGVDGTDGQDGADGLDGIDGNDWEPCTVNRIDRRNVEITCPDGSSVIIRGFHYGKIKSTTNSYHYYFGSN